MKSAFDEFTNLYELSKTLRFELIPIGKTADLIKKNKIFEKDETIKESYIQAKFYFDGLHRLFVKKALKEDKVGDIDLKELSSAWKGKVKDDRKYQEEQKKLFQKIGRLFDEEANRWKLDYQEKKKIKFSKSDIKQKGVSFLLSAGILGILKYEFSKEKENDFLKKGWPSLYVETKENPGKNRYIFDSFERFLTYLSRFQKTRENFYQTNGTSTAVASRIGQNFSLFLQNQEVFKNKYEEKVGEAGFLKKEYKIFGTEYYYKCFLQEGIDEYNKLIGKLNKKIKELRDVKQKQDGFVKADHPLFKTLYKQILGEVKKEKQLIEKKEDVPDVLKRFIEEAEKFFPRAQKMIVMLLNDNYENDYHGIYLKNSAINTISRRWLLPDKVRDFELALPQKSKSKDGDPKIKTFVSLLDVRKAIGSLNGEIFKEEYIKNTEKEGDKWQQFLEIFKEEFLELWEDFGKKDALVRVGLNTSLLMGKKILESAREYSGREEEVGAIKNLADSCLGIYQMFKYFALEAKKQDEIPIRISAEFYQEYDDLYENFDFIAYYNAFRNFLTKKLSEKEKIKLNFEKGNLLGGWAESPEGNAQYCAYILRRNKKYYLGITNYPNIFDAKKQPESKRLSGYYYERMVYRQLKSTTIYGPSYESLFGSKYADDKKKIKDADLINRIKKILETKTSSFSQLRTFIKKKYIDPKELAKDLSKTSLYNLNFVEAGGEYAERGEYKIKDSIKYLYLFEITNKDLKKEKRNGKDNIHTAYFEQLFSKINLKNPLIKLSGGGEVFRRKGTKNLPLRKKDGNALKFVDKKDGNKLKEVLQHRRYSEDKIFFHLPIVLNTGAGKTKQKRFNYECRIKIKEALERSAPVNILGIDRGEKHLAYYSIVDREGKILDQDSLNILAHGNQKINYHNLLHEREKERLKNRQSWEPVVKIKDLKKGYISHVIHKISHLAIKYNAIIVLEDLNMRFKQIRGGIEKSIYQQLEKALIDKLGYLAFKERSLTETGGVLKGYQLSAPFESFQKLGKQSGIIFYTQAEYTSVTDPLSGFRKNIYISNSVPIKDIKKRINFFKEIKWDNNRKSYFFKYNAKDFNDKSEIKLDDQKVYANVPRIQREKVRGYWKCEYVNPNELLEKLLKLWNFEEPMGDILRQIRIKEKNGDLNGKKTLNGRERNFYHSLIYIFNLILQLRNSFSKRMVFNEEGEIKEDGEDIDFIASPVEPFFTSASFSKGHKELNFNGNYDVFQNKFKCSNEDRKRILKEFNGDANGAYNIARKGIMILNSIQKNPEKPDLYITRDQWDSFASSMGKK